MKHYLSRGAGAHALGPEQARDRKARALAPLLRSHSSLCAAFGVVAKLARIPTCILHGSERWRVGRQCLGALVMIAAHVVHDVPIGLAYSHHSTCGLSSEQPMTSLYASTPPSWPASIACSRRQDAASARASASRRRTAVWVK